MMKQVSIALAAGLLVAGVSTASAAGMQSSTAMTKMSQPGSDTLSLTRAAAEDGVERPAWPGKRSKKRRPTLRKP